MTGLATSPRLAAAGLTPSALPLFRFGTARTGNCLTMLSGGLILDNGEADRTFIYRCQDRFLAYSALQGWRSLFFATDDSHVAHYRASIADLRRRFETIAARTELFAGKAPQEPLFALADAHDLEVRAPAILARQLADDGLVAAIASGVALNQASPIAATLVEGVARLLRQRGLPVDWPLEACRQAGASATRWCDKGAFLALVAQAAPSIRAAHTPTALFAPAELAPFESFAALSDAFARRAGAPAPQALFVKSTRNSAGNLAAVVDEASFGEAMAVLLETTREEARPTGDALARQAKELRREIEEAPTLALSFFDEQSLAAFKLLQADRRRDVAFLVQPLVDCPSDRRTLAGIGLSFLIEGDGAVAKIAVSGQVYRDPGHKQFLGAYLSETVERDVPTSFQTLAISLAGLLAERSFRGPVSFDARLGPDGDYQFIHDCNPRLTGVFPSLALREALRSEGVLVASLLTLGYRGEFALPDLSHALDRLEKAGLLFSAKRPHGVILLPNLCRANGYDAHLVNVPLAEAERLLARQDGPLARLSVAAFHPTRLYY